MLRYVLPLIATLLSPSVALAWTHGVAPPATTPITALSYGVPFVYNSSYPPQTVASDVWTNTWADDNNVYVLSDDMVYSWNAATTNCCNVELSELSGFTSSVVGTQINAMSAWGAENTDGSDGRTYKGFGLMSVSASLYMFVTRQAAFDGNNRQNEQNAQLLKSSDHGVTLTPAPPSTANPYTSPTFPVASYPNFAAPFFIQYGKDYQSNTVDNAGTYVYAISNNCCWNNGDSNILGRVKIANIGNQSAADWTFYTGGDGMQDSNWSSNPSGAATLISSAYQVSTASIQYIEAFNRYLMMVWYYPSVPGSLVTSDTRWAAYEAPHPWGPWTLVQQDEWAPSGLYNPTVVSKSLSTINAALVSATITTAGNFQLGGTTGPYTLTLVPVNISGITAVASFDPLNLGTGNTLSEANRTVLGGGSATAAYPAARTVMSASTGHLYTEYTVLANGSSDNYTAIGVASSSYSVNASTNPGFDGNLSAAVYGANTQVYINSTGNGTVSAFTQGDIVSMALDVPDKLIWFRTIAGGVTPGNWNGNASSNPANGSGDCCGISISAISAPYYAFVGTKYLEPVKFRANFGIVPYAGSVPSGYTNWPLN